MALAAIDRECLGRPGPVFLIGAGPGDPGLITVKGLSCLREAEVVVYDRLVSPELLGEAAANAELINVGKASGHHSIPQEQINEILIAKASEGKWVARLKGGDPVVFGRGGEEAEALAKAGIPFEIIPGVTSAIAVPAYAGIPVTQRGISSSLTIMTGHREGGRSERSGDPAQFAGQGVEGRSEVGAQRKSRVLCGAEIPRSSRGGNQIAECRMQSVEGGIQHSTFNIQHSNQGTCVVLMCVENLPAIVADLMDSGWNEETPAALILEGTTPRQKTIVGTLGNIVDKARAAEAPGLLVVGEVVRLRERLEWFEKREMAF